MASLLTSDFKKRVDLVVEKKAAFDDKRKDAVRTFVSFCHDYLMLYRACETRDERQYLNDKVGDEDRQTTYRAIGEQAATFLRSSVIKGLPAAQESLKVMARAGEKKIVSLIEDGRVTPLSSVADVRREVSGHGNSMDTTETAIDPLQHLTIVLGRDELLKWSDVESFKTDLAELLNKHKLSLRVDGFASLEERIQNTAEKYQNAAALHWDKLLTRTERAIERLIQQEYRKRVNAQYPRLKGGKKFKDAAARRRAAEKLTGLNPDEISGGVLCRNEMDRLHEGRFAVERYDGGDEHARSILSCAEMLGISEKAVVQIANDVRRRHKESERLKTLGKDYERICAIMETNDSDVLVTTFKTMHTPRRLKSVN